MRRHEYKGVQGGVEPGNFLVIVLNLWARIARSSRLIHPWIVYRWVPCMSIILMAHSHKHGRVFARGTSEGRRYAGGVPIVNVISAQLEK